MTSSTRPHEQDYRPIRVFTTSAPARQRLCATCSRSLNFLPKGKASTSFTGMRVASTFLRRSSIVQSLLLRLSGTPPWASRRGLRQAGVGYGRFPTTAASRLLAFADLSTSLQEKNAAPVAASASSTAI